MPNGTNNLVAASGSGFGKPARGNIFDVLAGFLNNAPPAIVDEYTIPTPVPDTPTTPIRGGRPVIQRGGRTEPTTTTPRRNIANRLVRQLFGIRGGLIGNNTGLPESGGPTAFERLSGTTAQGNTFGGLPAEGEGFTGFENINQNDVLADLLAGILQNILRRRNA